MFFHRLLSKLSFWQALMPKMWHKPESENINGMGSEVPLFTTLALQPFDVHLS